MHALWAVGRALGAHHGHFHTPGSHAKRALGLGGWPAAQKAALTALAAVFQVDPEPLLDGRKLPSGAVMALAGPTTFADWIGSDERFFPRAGNTPPSLQDYTAASYRQAKRAVEEIGWGRWQPDGGVRSFSELFPQLKSASNERQSLGREIAEGVSGPALVLIEAPMGLGKTEAALWLADWCLNRFRHQGIYVALPTQATSNQMFG